MQSLRQFPTPAQARFQDTDRTHSAMRSEQLQCHRLQLQLQLHPGHTGSQLPWVQFLQKLHGENRKIFHTFGTA
ncbi:hypothetical protein ACLKA6_015079 [Drosophila palustris]